jgi:DNA-binding SARP family transcriptional activator/Flp pilus assembly protein TadD
VEGRVETVFAALAKDDPGLEIRLLGTPAVTRGGIAIDMPASRKVVMLLSYLVLATRPVGRSHVCDLLWDVPNDPRGELRWCLTKLRRLLDTPERAVVQAQADHVSLALGEKEADVLSVEAASRVGIERLGADALDALAGRFGGAFLDGIQADRTPAFETWLSGRRRHYRTLHLAVLSRLSAVHPPGSPARLAAVEQLAALATDDVNAHLALLEELAEHRDFAGGEAHLSAATRLFASEGLDPDPLRTAWRTLRSRGQSLPAPLDPVPASATARDAAGRVSDAAVPRARPRVAIMPPSSQSPGASPFVDAIAHDIIGRLARLRSLAVIAWGSVSALARRGLAPDEAATALRADYLGSVSLLRGGARDSLAVELVDTATLSILWSDTFELGQGDGLVLLETVGGAVVSSLAHAVEIAERNRALVKTPGSLDAWETYHRGLWHMYQFTEAENHLAQTDFQAASDLDPTFARAFAGLSFTHWQSAFQRWGDRAAETAAAEAAASRSLLADDLDPMAHWAMGRALWLRGSHGESLSELHRAVDISPSFALGHYAIAFVQSQSGDPGEAIRSAEQSRQLSPYDPLLFGTYGALAMAHARLEHFLDASEWALLAAAQPNAHNIILAIAAHCAALAGRMDEARGLAARLRMREPSYTTADFLATFHFSQDGQRIFLQAGRSLGLA